MVNSSSFEVTANGYTDDNRAAKGTVRPPTLSGHLVPELHEGGPDVIKKLDLDDRFQASRGESNGETNDSCLGQRTVEDTLTTKLSLQTSKSI